MEKTIKELAEELGITKDKVKYQVRKLPSKLTINRNVVTYLGVEAISIIKSELKNNSKGKQTGKLPIEYLMEELEKKDYELKEKNKQIDVLHRMFEQQQKLLDQQQVLTLQANKKIEQLELQQEEKVSDVSEEIQTLKKSFWQRLFGN